PRVRRRAAPAARRRPRARDPLLGDGRRPAHRDPGAAPPAAADPATRPLATAAPAGRRWQGAAGGYAWWLRNGCNNGPRQGGGVRHYGEGGAGFVNAVRARSTLLQPGRRVDRLAIAAQLEVQPGPALSAGVADGGNRIATRH